MHSVVFFHVLKLWDEVVNQSIAFEENIKIIFRKQYTLPETIFKNLFQKA